MIKKGAFSGCSSLKCVFIPVTVEKIDESVFDECENLTDIFYTGSEQRWSTIEFGEGNDALDSAAIHYNYGAKI